MEKTTTGIHRNSLRVIALGSALGLTATLSGCGFGREEIKANLVVEIISEELDQRYISAPESGGYPHYEDVFRFVVQQCQREDLPEANEDGCVNFDIVVEEQEFNEFGPGDRIVFPSARSGYPSNPDQE